MYINYVCVFQNYSVNQIRIYFLLLQEDLGTDYQIAYIDIKEGDKTGCIRMKDEDSAQKLTAAPSGSYFFTLLKGQFVDILAHLVDHISLHFWKVSVCRHSSTPSGSYFFTLLKGQCVCRHSSTPSGSYFFTLLKGQCV